MYEEDIKRPTPERSCFKVFFYSPGSNCELRSVVEADGLRIEYTPSSIASAYKYMAPKPSRLFVFDTLENARRFSVDSLRSWRDYQIREVTAYRVVSAPPGLPLRMLRKMDFNAGAFISFWKTPSTWMVEEGKPTYRTPASRGSLCCEFLTIGRAVETFRFHSTDPKQRLIELGWYFRQRTDSDNY